MPPAKLIASIKNILSQLDRSSKIERDVLIEISKVEQNDLEQKLTAQVLNEIHKEVLNITHEKPKKDIGVAELIALSKYEINVKKFNDDSSEMPFSLRENHNYYKLHISQSISTAWFIITGFDWGTKAGPAARILIGYGYGRHQKTEAKVAIEQFSELYKLLLGFHKFLCGKYEKLHPRSQNVLEKQGRSFASPTLELAENYLKSNMANEYIPAKLLQEIHKNNGFNNNNDGKFDANFYMKMVNSEREGASSGVSGVCHESREVDIKSLEMELKELTKKELPCMTFDALIKKLQSSNNGIELDKDNQVVMESANWNILYYSTIVSYMFFKTLMR